MVKLKAIPFKRGKPYSLRFNFGEPTSLRRNFLWTSVGNLVYNGCQWGVLVILAKLGNTEMVGQYALGLAIAWPIISFTNLNLRAVQATDAKYTYLFGDYLALRLILTFLALLIIMGIVIFSGYSLLTAQVILVVGFSKGVDAVSDIFYGLFQRYEQMDRIAQSMMIKGLLSLLLLFTGLYLSGGVLWGTIGLLIALTLVMFCYDIPVARRLVQALPLFLEGQKIEPCSSVNPLWAGWQIPTLIQLSILALPLGIIMMLISLGSNIPRYFIEHYNGVSALGIFAALTYFSIAGNTIVAALGQSAVPRLANYMAQGDIPAFRNLVVKLLKVGAVLGGAGILVISFAGPQILTVFYTKEYAARADVLLWLMWGALFMYEFSFLGHAITAMRQFKIQVPMNIWNLIVIFLLCLFLIKPYGLVGAAWVFLFGNLVSMCTYAIMVFRKISSLRSESEANIHG